MTKHKKLSARILSMALSVAMVSTMLPTTVFATEGDVPLGASSINTVGTIKSFDKLEDRFAKSTGTNAPDHVYSLSVALNTPVEDLNLPDELTAMVARTTAAPTQEEPVKDSGKPSEPAEDKVVEGDTTTDDTVSGNQPASPSDAEEEIKDEDVPLAPEPEQDKETTVTTVKTETVAVTWTSDKEYKSDVNGKFIYTAVLPEGYTLADGISAPQIYVMVGNQARSSNANATTHNVGTVDEWKTAAANALSGDTIKLTANIALTEETTFSQDVLTLNVNGKELSGNQQISYGPFISFRGKTSFTVTGGGTVVNAGSNGVTIRTWDTGCITVNAGTTVSATGASEFSSAISSNSGGEIIVNGGTVWANGGMAIAVTNQPAKVTIKTGSSVASFNESEYGGTITIFKAFQSDPKETLIIESGATVTGPMGNAIYFSESEVTSENITDYLTLATGATIRGKINPALPVSATSITVGTQTGALSYKGDSMRPATFAIAASGFATAPAAADYSLAWYSDAAGTTSTTEPSLTITKTSATVLTIAAGTANAGTYYFKLTATKGSETASSGVVVVTVNKANASWKMYEVTATVHKDGKIGTSAALPATPAGATYGILSATGDIAMTDMSIAGDILTYTASASTAGDISEITIPVTTATNYNDYSIVVTITSTAQAEQFNLPLQGIYYFDLSAETGTVVFDDLMGYVSERFGAINGLMPDITLHYVPFSYVGTVNSYSLDSTSIGDKASSNTASANPSDRSLFLSDYWVSRCVNWNTLNTNNLIFGKTFATNYKLRSMSAGNANDGTIASPMNNEWDSILGKVGLDDPIKNWENMFAWGQDTDWGFAGSRAVRGGNDNAYAYDNREPNNPTQLTEAFRPVLEVLNPTTLTADGLKAVALDLNGGKLINFFNVEIASKLNIICAGETYTAPSATGIVRPVGDTGTGFSWNTKADGTGTKYAAGASVPKAVAQLYAQWEVGGTHVPVTNITGVSTAATAGTNLTLTGTVAPTTATNKTIVWSVKTAGTTGATISGSTLSTTAAGTVVVTATITNGKTASTNYTQDFTITVSAPKTPASIAVTTPPTKTAYTTGETFDKAGMVVTATYADSTTAAVSGYTFSPNTALAKTDTTIIISYTENGTTKTTTQAITVTDAPTTYTVTISGGGTGAGNYAPGATVSIDAGSKSGYTFNGWTASPSVVFANASSASTTFVMPSSNVTVTSTWTYNGGGGGGGGGSSSGGSSTPTTKPTEPVTGNSNTNATVDNKGNTTVNVSDKNISDAVKAAQDAATKKGVNAGEVTAVINVTSPANSNPNTVSVNLPKNVQEQIISNRIGNVAIVIDKPDISIGMTLATITEMNKQAKSDIQLSATRTDATKLSTEAKNAIGSRPAFDLKATYASGSKSVTNFGTGTVSIAIPYTLQKGEIAGGLYAVYVDGNGKVSYITNSSYDAENKVLRFSTNHFSVYGISYKAPVGFTDITTHWAKTDIEFVANRGLMNGTSNTTFSPNSSMTRGMFVTALGRLAGVNVDSYKTAKFTDVKTDTYYAPYVNWAAEKGIVKGTTDTTFAPDQAITRQEMATIMSSYAKALGYQVPETRAAVTFADNASIGSWAAPAVKQMQMAGILNGKDSNKFDPTGTATRGEISAMLRRYVELVIDRTTTEGWTTNDSGSSLYYQSGKAVTGTKTISNVAYTFNGYGETTRKTSTAGATTNPALPADGKKYITHKIVKGDTLWDLAQKHGTTVNAIVSLNNIQNRNAVPVGTEIKIPQK